MSVINFTPAETQRKHVDAAFTCSAAIERVTAMQLLESDMAQAIADAIALRVHGESVKELPAKERQECWFAAVQAVRSQHECWRDAAHHHAVESVETWMQTEGGRAFTHLTPTHRHALAVNLTSVVLVAMSRILEGTKPLSAGEYLRIVEDK